MYPEFLWALSLLTVPVLIHLFSFRRYKTLYFSSLEFVHHVEQQNKSAQKLKNLLILICRLLMLALIILAFAQPYFPSSAKVQTGSAPVLSIHIDNSFSMTMKCVEGELLSEATEAARQLIQKAPLNTKILLSTNALDGVEARISTKTQALERLDQLQPSPMVRSFDEVIKWQKDNLKKKVLTRYRANFVSACSVINAAIPAFHPYKLHNDTYLLKWINDGKRVSSGETSRSTG